MRSWICRGRLLVGVAALGLGGAGCAAQHGDSLRVSEELGRARADAAWQQARAAELESRISRLEQQTSATVSAQGADERALARRLDRLLEMNERLLAERAATPVPASLPALPVASTPALPVASAPAATASPTSSATAGADLLRDEQELRALVLRLRGRADSPHGGLTREQEAALRVLIRPERTLDTENPWPTAIY